MPACDFYAATFERLFRALVHPRASVAETACEACGDDACRFEVRW
ncbi:4-vinyl reductase [Azohydromonas sediminis]|nr:4-vinyl reductase [Azohydromonas sediminis]